MNQFIFKNLLILVFFFSASWISRAQSQFMVDTLAVNENCADKYVLRWGKLIPRYAKMQIAGGMGVVSVGGGWEYGKNEQWETDLLFGYIPKFDNDKITLTLTLKQNFTPWKIPLNDTYYIEPISTGIYVNRVFSENFWTVEPSRYGGPYYKFATSLRFSLFVGQRFSMKLNKGRGCWKYASAFYELSSNDLYLFSYYSNPRTLSLKDILILSFGVKVQVL